MLANQQESFEVTMPGKASHENGCKVWIYFLSLSLCAALLFLVGLGKRDLWPPDEPRVAGIAAEMGRSGDMVVPRLNGEPFLEKPPLYFWAASATLNLLGENSYTARIPSALAAICGIALVFFLARSMGFSAFTAIVSGFILATSAGYWALGRSCVVDMMLCLFVTCAMVCFFHTSRTLSRKALWYGGFILSLSCALMTKGLVGLAIPLSVLTAWLLLEKNFSFRVWGLLSLSPALCLIPAAIWIWLLYNNLGWDAVYEVVWTNNIGRFTGSHHHHIEPFYYYITRFPQKLFPWVLFLPFALVYHLREIREQDTEKHFLFFLSWLVVPFMLLSISEAKRGLYLLPLYPAAALLVGTAVGRALEKGETSTKLFSIPSVILSGSIILASLGFCGMCIYFKQPFFFCLLVSLPGLCLGVRAYIQLSKKTKKDLAGFFVTIIAAMVVLFLTFDIGIAPFSNQKNSYGPLFKYFEKLRSEGARISLFKPSERLRGAAVFYLKRTAPVIREGEKLKDFLRSEKKAVAISRKTNLKIFNTLDIMNTFIVRNKTIVFVRDDHVD